MEKEELILLLNSLLKNPSLIKNISDKGIDSEFGLIRLEPTGCRVDITLHNGITISVSNAYDSDYIEELYNAVKKEAEEFGIFILKKKLQLCHEANSNNSNSTELD